MRILVYVLVMIVFLQYGCINPYQLASNSYFRSSEQTGTQNTINFEPLVEENRVHPIKKIIVKGIEENSPAEQAGLQVGDEILSINGRVFEIAETYKEYLDKARWIAKTYRIKRSIGQGYAEKDIVVQPEKDFFYSGIFHKYIDNNDNVFYPRYRSQAWIYQGGKNFNLSATMGYEGSLVVLVFEIDNLSQNELIFDKSEILLFDGRKRVLPILSEAEVMAYRYNEFLSKNPMVALQTIPTMTAIQSTKRDTQIRVPNATIWRDKVYAKGEDIKFPITVKIEVRSESFQFQFGIPQKGTKKEG